MELHNLGMNYSHDSNFKVNRDNGSGDNLLLIFKTRASVILKGERFIAEPNSALLYKNFEPQIYSSTDVLYVNHWVHMDCEDDLDFLAKSGLPFNTIFTISNIAKVETLLTEIASINLSVSSVKEYYIDLLIRMLILNLGEEYKNNLTDIQTNSHNPYFEVLNNLRAVIYSNPSRYGSISEIANTINISSSHFQYLYSKQFGVSCYDDILTARINSAKYYLENTDMTVKSIAIMCGYENDVHFMRQFKRKALLTPTQYRKTKLI